MAAICQAEVRLVLCHVGPEPSPGGDGGASTRSDAGPAGAGDQESTCPGPSQGPSSSETQQAPRAGIEAGAGIGPEAASQLPASPAPAPAASAPSRGAPRGPSLLQLSMLLPPPTTGSGGVAPGPCRSVQCHVAWVGEVEDAVRYDKEGHGFGAASSNDVLTLVVGWGPELELVSWSTRALRAAAAASTALAGPLSPVSRRTLLLGVPGPLCAVSLGPYGTVIATTEAGLALSYSSVQAPAAEQYIGPASGTGNDAGRAGGGGGGCEAARSDGTDRSAGGAQSTRPDFEDTHQKQQQPHKQLETEVIDLRGVLTAAGSSGLTQFGDGGSGEGAGPSLAGLFNISAGVRLDGDGDGDGGAGTSGMGARGHKAAAAVPMQFLLGAEGAEGLTCGRSVGLAASSTVAGATTAAVVAAASASALCVVWPCRSIAAAAATAAASDDYLGREPCSHPTASDAHPSRGPAAAVSTAGPAGGGGGRDGGGGFCSLAPLHLPRPDLISCCGGLVLAASSLGPPVVAAFRLTPHGGLTQLACLTPAWPPDVIAAGRGRLRGLAAALVPSSSGGDDGGAAAAAAGDGQEVRGHGGGRHSAAAAAAAAVDSSPEAVLVVAAGEMDAAPAGGGIFGFGRSGRTVGQKMVRLVASAHPLPPLLAAAAATAVAEMAAEAGAAAAEAWEAGPSGVTGTVAPAADAAAPCLAGSAPCERSDEATAASLGPLTAPAADAIVAAVVGQLAELLAGFRRHVDQRLDKLAGALEAQAARLDRIEVALGARQQLGEALLQRWEGV